MNTADGIREDGTVSGKRFGEIVDMGKSGVSKMIKDGKLHLADANNLKASLDAGASYFYENGGKALRIHLENARKELNTCTNPNTCKSKGLLKWLGLVKGDAGKHAVSLNGLKPNEVRDAIQRQQLLLLELEVEEKKKKLGDLEVINMHLEAVGLELRDKIMSVAARVTGKIRRASSDHEGELILYGELEAALLEVATINAEDSLID